MIKPVSVTDGLTALYPLMESTSTTLSPAAFHAAVDRAFHDAEASEYDKLHGAMWASLPQQFALLTDDVVAAAGVALPASLAVADIGCGTGQSAAALLATRLGSRITHIDLTDLSDRMLIKAGERARTWSVSHELHLGGVDALPDRRYDVILVCSVLHHVPALPTFLAAVRNRQPDGGIFLHLQDPHAGMLENPVAAARYARYRRLTRPRVPPSVQALAPRPLVARLWRRLTGRRAYIDAANDRLLADRVIARAMTPEEFWSVTDIHVPGLPYSSGDGIALERIGEGLGDYALLSARTYGFFGEPHYAIPEALRPEEQRLIGELAMDGHLLAAAWQRRVKS